MLLFYYTLKIEKEQISFKKIQKKIGNGINQGLKNLMLPDCIKCLPGKFSRFHFYCRQLED